MLRRALVLLLASVALAGCGNSYSAGSRGGYRPPFAAPEPSRPLVTQRADSTRPATRVAILLPLSGPNAERGQAMLRGAQLALPYGSIPALGSHDTGGTPDGAAAAARDAVASGAGLILGPLTSAETAAVAPIARDAGVAVLAFTNDPSQAQPGVWTLGITPAQQVFRLIAAGHGQGRGRVAALLPESDFGHSVADATGRAATALGLPAPAIYFHRPEMASINASVRELADYANRRGPIEAQIRAARARGTPEGRREAQELAKTRIPPPPFDMLVLAESGEKLAEISTLLQYYDIDPGAVQILGPAQWASPASGSGNLPGAWYAAPDPAARAGLEQDYTAQFGVRPPALADLAYDAAALARIIAERGRFSIAALTQIASFPGADGWFRLLLDGEVQRGLAVFRVERGTPSMVEPAPAPAPHDGSGS